MYHMYIYKQHKYISTVYLRIYTVYIQCIHTVNGGQILFSAPLAPLGSKKSKIGLHFRR